MSRKLVISLIILMLVPTAWAKQDINIDPDYDPRIELRVVVMPALKDRSLRRLDERTVSALFATELLRVYEVLDLDRFEQYLSDRGLTLDAALASTSESVVRDSARVDALADVEIYRWDAGTAGIPLLGRKKGNIGVRVRIMDPYSGRIYWSINRLESVKPGTEILDRLTSLFRDIVGDLDEELTMIVETRNEQETALQVAAGPETKPIPNKSRRVYTTGTVSRDKGFVSMEPARRFGADVLTEVQPVDYTDQVASTPEHEVKGSDPRTLLPPLFETSFEDVEAGEQEAAPEVSKRDMYLTPPELRTGTSRAGSSNAPPVPERFNNITGTLPTIETTGSQGELESQPDTTAGN